jgi:hypothetical protein
MDNANILVERYIQSWNEIDPVRRRKLLEATFVEHAEYTDPMIDVQGWNGIDATIASVQKMFPGHGGAQICPTRSPQVLCQIRCGELREKILPNPALVFSRKRPGSTRHFA